MSWNRQIAKIPERLGMAQQMLSQGGMNLSFLKQSLKRALPFLAFAILSSALIPNGLSQVPPGTMPPPTSCRTDGWSYATDETYQNWSNCAPETETDAEWVDVGPNDPAYQDGYRTQMRANAN